MVCCITAMLYAATPLEYAPICAEFAVLANADIATNNDSVDMFFMYGLSLAYPDIISHFAYLEKYKIIFR